MDEKINTPQGDTTLWSRLGRLFTHLTLIFRKERERFVYFCQYLRRRAGVLVHVAQRLKCRSHISNRGDAGLFHVGNGGIDPGLHDAARSREQAIESLFLLFKVFIHVIKASGGQSERAERCNGDGGPQPSCALAEPSCQSRDSGDDAEQIRQITDEFMVIFKEVIEALLEKIHGEPPVAGCGLGNSHFTSGSAPRPILSPQAGEGNKAG